MFVVVSEVVVADLLETFARHGVSMRDPHLWVFVQVVMQAVQQEHEEFLSILLIVAFEVFKSDAKHSLERSGVNIACTGRTEPNAFENVGQCAADFSLWTLLVALRYLKILQILISKEVERKVCDIAQALQSWVHVAGVAEID